MRKEENVLLILLMVYKDNKNTQADILQKYIAEYGPLSKELNDKVKKYYNS